MESPLPYDDQADEIKSQFNQLLNANIFSTNDNSSEEETRALDGHVQNEVTAKPILARIMKGNASLLSVACTNLDDEYFHPAIKCIIGANPSALLWDTATYIYTVERMIHKVAGHPTLCVLMPWIAANYQWVLDHEILCLEDPPVFCLINQYANRGATKCSAAIIQQFFEAFPRGLTQINKKYGFTPLHAIICRCKHECEPDLFKWIAEKYPSNMLKTDRNKAAPLHYACRSLTRHLGDNLSEICKYIISKCPESVRMRTNGSELPVHVLLRHSQHRTIKEVVVCLMRAYPESYNMATSGGRVPSSIPFIQRIKPLLDEEKELKENVAYLQEVSRVFQDAVDDTPNPIQLASSTCDTFGNWATVSFVPRLETKMALIVTELQNECNADR